MRYITIIAALLMVLFVMGCNDTTPSADKTQRAATEKLMQEAQRQTGMPNITRFTQKKTLKMIMEECDKADLICYAYLKADYTGELVFIGKCIGYGVPFSAQYTNPQRIAWRSNSGGATALPQPDPNGLFMPNSSSATWLLLIDPKTNEPRPAYIEPELVVSPFKLH